MTRFGRWGYLVMVTCFLFVEEGGDFWARKPDQYKDVIVRTKIVRYLGNHMNKHADRETTKKGVLPLAAQIPAVVGWLLRFPLQPQPDSVCVKIKLKPLPS